jgi:hypothetical protein
MRKAAFGVRLSKNRTTGYISHSGALQSLKTARGLPFASADVDRNNRDGPLLEKGGEMKKLLFWIVIFMLLVLPLAVKSAVLG